MRSPMCVCTFPFGALLQEQLPKWQAELEPRRLEPLLDALHSALEAEAAAAEVGVRSAAGVTAPQQAGVTAPEPPVGDDLAELAKTLRARVHWLGAADHRKATTGVGQQLDQLDAVVRQRRLRDAVGLLADASGNDLLQEERLQEFGELFCRCAGETASAEDAEVLLQTLAALDELEAGGDALHKLVMVLLALLPETASGVEDSCALAETEGVTSPAKTEGLTSQIAEWKRRVEATENARELCGFTAAACREASAAPQEECAAALERLRKWLKRPEADPVPLALGKEAEKAAEELRSWLAMTCEAALHKCKSVVEGRLPGFQEASGGRRGGGHWQAALTGSSRWEDVLQEATYHLLTPDASGKAYSERMAALSSELTAGLTALGEALATSAACAELGAAVAGVTALEDECRALATRSEAAIAHARVVDTEGYFCQVLSTARTDKASGKLRHRIAQMAKKGVDCSAIHPLIWARVMSTSGA